MDKNETKNELIKRYAYLYENKECILALCAVKAEDENYYLNKSASDDALTVFEEFLFTDRNIENTELFKYIELLKLSSSYYAAVRDVVERIEQEVEQIRHDSLCPLSFKLLNQIILPNLFLFSDFGKIVSSLWELKMLKQQNHFITKVREEIHNKILEMQLGQIEKDIKECLRAMETAESFSDDVYERYEMLKKDRQALLNEKNI